MTHCKYFVRNKLPVDLYTGGLSAGDDPDGQQDGQVNAGQSEWRAASTVRISSGPVCQMHGWRFPL